MNILLSFDVISSKSGDPIRAGVVLYYALNSANRVAIMTEHNEKYAEHWLHSHGIIGYDDLLTDFYALHGENLKKRQITISRQTSPVEMYVDTDPEICAWTFEQGIPTVLFMPPSYIAIDRRPDMPKWADIEKTITEQNIAKSQDRRLSHDTDLLWDEA